MAGRKFSTIVVVITVFLYSNVRADTFCDPRLPHCRNQPVEGMKRPECKPFWLLPGKASDCTKPSSQQLIKIDSQSVTITPNVIKLPGCFTMTMKVEISPQQNYLSYLSKVEYDWWNFPQFAALQCQNTSSDGCGGYGNNCYYCDICRNLRELDSNGRVRDESTIAQQFRDVRCPTKAGFYQLQKQFCFNDFNEFDKNHNCEPDFLEKGTDGSSNYESAMKNVEKMGFGTVTAKFTLAHNSTQEQLARKASKEAELEQTVDAELAQKRQENNWAMNDGQYQSFRRWYIQNRKDRWHKQEYLPWLLYNNEAGCLTVNFEVCNQAPRPMAKGSVTMLCI